MHDDFTIVYEKGSNDDADAGTGAEGLGGAEVQNSGSCDFEERARGYE